MYGKFIQRASALDLCVANFVLLFSTPLSLRGPTLALGTRGFAISDISSRYFYHS